MKFHVSGRQTGKTWRMVRWALLGPLYGERRIIVTHSEREVGRLESEYGVEAVSWRYAPPLGGPEPVLGVDNLDLILKAKWGLEIARVAATGQTEYFWEVQHDDG